MEPERLHYYLSETAVGARGTPARRYRTIYFTPLVSV